MTESRNGNSSNKAHGSKNNPKSNMGNKKREEFLNESNQKLSLNEVSYEA